MTATFTNWNQFDMFPGKRPLEGDYKKTIIVITGESNTGKSTISDELKKEDFSYISADNLLLKSDHQIQALYCFVSQWSDAFNTNVREVCQMLNLSGNACWEFIDYMFGFYIIPNKAKNILLDGYMFDLGNIRNAFLNRCTSLDYYVWELRRVQ